MSTSLIPIPDDTIYWSSPLLDITKPVLLTEQQCDAFWPLMNTVYTKLGGLLPQINGTIEIQNYECRLGKSKQSGKAPTSKDGDKKRYGTTTAIWLMLCTEQNNAYHESTYRHHN